MDSDNRTRRSFLRYAGAGAGAVGLAGCSELTGDGPTDTPSGTPTSGLNDAALDIGVLTIGGKRNPIWNGIVTGAKIAASELNEGGYPVDVNVHSRSAEGSLETAQAQFTELVDDVGIDVLTGVFRSELLLPIQERAAEDGIPFLSTGAASSQATLRVKNNYEKYKNYFRVGPVNDVFIGDSLTSFGAERFDSMGWEKVMVYHEDFQWTRKVAQVLTGGDEQFDGLNSRAGVAVDSESYSPDRRDFTEVYRRFEEEGYDGVIPLMTTTGNSALIDWQQMKPSFGFMGVHVPMQLPQYYRAVNGAARYGGTLAFGSEASATDVGRQFIESYRQETANEPVYTGYTTYDAVTLYAKKIREVGERRGDALINAMEEASHPGTGGTVAFYGQNDRFPHDLRYGEDYVQPVMIQWQSENEQGIQKVIWPDDVQQGEYRSPEWTQSE